MDKEDNKADNLLEYYTQTKQRLDLDIDIEKAEIKAQTKLTFIKNKEIPEESINKMVLKLNCENIIINQIQIENTEKRSQILTYKSSNVYYTKNYLNTLYENIVDIDSFENINRVEWEIRNSGSLIIYIPKLFYQAKPENNKLKIYIEYELIEHSLGIIFQNFYDEKSNQNYSICYTPNYYFNTCNYVPCVYDLSKQIEWRLYIIIPYYYICYSSLRLIKIEKSNISKKLMVFFSIEPITARNLGFIIVNEKNLIRISESSVYTSTAAEKKGNININNNYYIVANESKKEIIIKNMINNKLISTLSSFYEDIIDIDNNNNNEGNSYINQTCIVFIPYIIFDSLNTNFDKFCKGKDEHYFSMIKFPFLYILPEKYIYTPEIPEISKFQLKAISKIFIYNYFGGLITEKTYSDFWILNGFESWLSNLFISKTYGTSYMRSKLYNNLLKYYKICKQGLEKLPLYTNNFTHPMELQINPIVYIKSSLIIHILEAHVETIYIQKALKNIIHERRTKGYNISTDNLIEIFKKNCGNNLSHFISIWVKKTGMFEIKMEYSYCQKTNSVEIKISQSQVAKKYYNNNPYFKINEVDYESLNKYKKHLQVIDYKTKANIYFNFLIQLNIFQTNGIEIMKDSHQIKLEEEKINHCQNFPLISKMRKRPLKKREQDFIQDIITNTAISKIYSNEEIEEIFADNSILYIRLDADLSAFRIINIKQRHILYDYIKLFNEGDIVGQMESLYQIKKDVKNYSNSLIILKKLIESNLFYKLRQYAIKTYVKIVIKTKNENEYQFLIDYLEDCYHELLKSKTTLNHDTYFVMKEIIKQLSCYREEYFNSFFVIGLVTNSTIQNKIIDKFLSILISNELNTINNYNDSYITSQILVGCSKLNLQEKSLLVLKKILKNLRVEKLKRSFNEIVISSSIIAFLNIMIKNKFFVTKKDTYESIIIEILHEINYYINSECENYELCVVLCLFQLLFNFYKSQSFNDFSQVLKNSFIDNCNNIYIKQNLKIEIKMKALMFLFEIIGFSFNNINEKITLLKIIRNILISPYSYYNNELKQISFNIYNKMLHLNVNSDTNIYDTNSKDNDKYINIYNLLENNCVFFNRKKFADEDWICSFIHEDYYYNNQKDFMNSEISSEINSRIEGVSFKSNNKYKKLSRNTSIDYNFDNNQDN